MSGGGEVGRAFARGVIAAMAMSGLRKVTTGLGLVEQIPPERVALEGVPALVRQIPPERRDVVVELTHWGYGGVGAAAFGLLPGFVRRQEWSGPLYGVAVWLGYEVALAPILGLHRRSDPSLTERAALIADHVLYGVVVASSPWPHEAHKREEAPVTTILQALRGQLVVPDGLKGRHLLRIADWNVRELELLLDVADELKELQRQHEPHRPLEGRALGLLFDKPSTRTRVSFEVGIAQLGGTALFLPADQLQVARGEPLRDTITVLARYLDALAVRISSHEDVETLARHASIPVLNALTDAAHPCQALADLMTLRERLGELAGRRLVWIGAGNNVCSSLLVAATTFGMHVVAATPLGYEPPDATLELAGEAAARSGGSLELVRDPRHAVVDADALATDVWTSMGQEAEQACRRADLAGLQIDAELLRRAGTQAIVLHCLPAHDGEEITSEVLYGPQSAVWDQAENRLHAQKAPLALVVR